MTGSSDRDKDIEAQSQKFLAELKAATPIYEEGGFGQLAMARWKCGVCGKEGSKTWLDYYHQDCKGRGPQWRP